MSHNSFVIVFNRLGEPFSALELWVRFPVECVWNVLGVILSSGQVSTSRSCVWGERRIVQPPEIIELRLLIWFKYRPFMIPALNGLHCELTDIVEFIDGDA